MNRDEEPPLVTFAVKDGEQLFMCVGKLIREGHFAYAEPVDFFGNPPDLPQRIKLDPSQLEFDDDAAPSPERYIHRGYVVIQR